MLLLYRRLTVCHSFIAWEHQVSRQGQQQQQPSTPSLHWIQHPRQYRPSTTSSTYPTQQRRRIYASIQEPPANTSSIAGDVEDDDDSLSSSNVLSGVTDFESWFRSIPGAKCDPSIRHEDFGNLRGLGYTIGVVGSDTTMAGGQRKEWMTIPRSIVLQCDFSQVDWDSRLAQTLWQEVMRGRSSTVAGYTSLLVRGWTINDLPNLPPSTAIDALRHWTDEQKSVLASTSSGQRLLDLQKQQEELWRGKFRDVNGMTWEQFVWAMEVVHSRAFCGDW